MQYLSTADLSTFYLSSYSFVSANWLTVYRQPVHLSYNQYAVFVYRWPVCHLSFFLFVYICKLPACRRPVNLCPLTTADLSTVYLSSYSFVSANWLTVYRWPVHLSYNLYAVFVYPPSVYLSFYSFISANCLPAAHLSTFVHWLPPTCLHVPSFHSFVSANCLPVYRRPAHLCPLTICLLPTCLPPICTPVFFYMPRADLSAIHLSSYSFLSANCLPVYWLPVYCRPAHQCTPNTSTYVHLYAVWSRTLIYCASIQENCIGTTSTNTISNLRKFPFISVA